MEEKKRLEQMKEKKQFEIAVLELNTMEEFEDK